MKKTRKKSQPLFYTRKPRRPLSKKQKRKIKFLLPKYLLKKNVVDKKQLILEIGSGYGENLIKIAKKNNKKSIIGCEVYEPAIANILEKIEDHKLENISIYPKNIFSLLKILRKNSVEKIFILYPDPWPKKRHYKRRLISQFFLEKIYKILQKKGLIFIATDSQDYLQAILIEFFSFKKFIWTNNKVSECFKRHKDLVQSKYEKKADIKGNKKFFLKFKKMC